MLTSILTWCFSWMIYLYGFTMFHSVDKPTSDYTKNLIATQNIYYNTSQTLEPVHFFIEDLQNDTQQLQMAQNFIKQAKPLKLTFRNELNIFKDYDNFNENIPDQFKNTNDTHMVTTLWMGYGSAYNTDFASFARTLINEYPVSFLKFTGNYVAGGSHSDASISGCLNFYYLKQGEKKVTLIPPEGAEYIDMYYDKHSVTPKDELYDISNTNANKDRFICYNDNCSEPFKIGIDTKTNLSYIYGSSLDFLNIIFLDNIRYGELMGIYYVASYDGNRFNRNGILTDIENNIYVGFYENRIGECVVFANTKYEAVIERGTKSNPQNDEWVLSTFYHRKLAETTEDDVEQDDDGLVNLYWHNNGQTYNQFFLPFKTYKIEPKQYNWTINGNLSSDWRFTEIIIFKDSNNDQKHKLMSWADTDCIEQYLGQKYSINIWKYANFMLIVSVPFVYLLLTLMLFYSIILWGFTMLYFMDKHQEDLAFICCCDYIKIICVPNNLFTQLCICNWCCHDCGRGNCCHDGCCGCGLFTNWRNCCGFYQTCCCCPSCSNVKCTQKYLCLMGPCCRHQLMINIMVYPFVAFIQNIINLIYCYVYYKLNKDITNFLYCLVFDYIISSNINIRSSYSKKKKKKK
eukprot:434465_1